MTNKWSEGATKSQRDGTDAGRRKTQAETVIDLDETHADCRGLVMKIVYEYWTERLKPLLLAMFFWYSSSMAVFGDGVTWTDRPATGRVGPGRRLQLTPSAALIQPVVSNFHPRSPDMRT